MKAPRSFTGEDVLEIHGHGGEQNLKSLLHAVLQEGAELAAPGEFTRRAFLSGKLDLTQAEGLVATVSAQTQESLRHARRHLNGELGRCVSELRQKAVELLARIEAHLDFPEAAAEVELFLETVLPALQQQTSRLAESFSHGGRVLGRGLRVVLLGSANAGKSSLVNALCRGERVLVHDQPGTTRDFVEVRTTIGELTAVLVDTAGYRERGTELEEQGWRLSRQQHEQADFLWLVVDGARGLDRADMQVLDARRPEVPTIIVWNKVDQQGCLLPPADMPVVCCSALCGWGLEELRTQTLSRVLSGHDPGELVVTSARQAMLLRHASQHLERAVQAAKSSHSLDIVASDIREAATRLGEVSGERTSPEVLDSIFGQFCIGK